MVLGNSSYYYSMEYKYNTIPTTISGFEWLVNKSFSSGIDAYPLQMLILLTKTQTAWQNDRTKICYQSCLKEIKISV